MKNLKRVEQPVPVQPAWKICVACNAFRAECYVPVGDGSKQMCWVCAHLHVEHNVPLHKILDSEACDCAPHVIYPDRPEPVKEPAPQQMTLREQEREKLLKLPPEKLADWVREAHKQLSMSQLAAVKKRLN